MLPLSTSRSYATPSCVSLPTPIYYSPPIPVSRSILPKYWYWLEAELNAQQQSQVSIAYVID